MICVCGGKCFEKVAEWHERPAGETDFGFKNYYRSLHTCYFCGHFVSDNRMIEPTFYEDLYSKVTYPNGLLDPFEKIISLPVSQSNNLGRVHRINRFSPPGTLLDYGSGLCVFPYEMQKRGWDCSVYDQDEQVMSHAEQLCLSTTLDEQGWNAITFNNVLEHTKDPINILKHIKKDVISFVYLEVPDGEKAAKEGYEREEFFVEHWHVFTMASVALLARNSGFTIAEMERLKEPSGIYTIRAFLRP